MKLRIELDLWDTPKLFSKDDYKNYYEEYYNRDGILFDYDSESIYYDIEIDNMIMEGQTIRCKYGTCIVTYSFLDICNDSNWYFDVSRIAAKIQ